jgi:peptidoglycan/LPS O-acetylase OafA/YrhL
MSATVIDMPEPRRAPTSTAAVVAFAPPQIEYIAGLTSLRFFAALAVVLYHTLDLWPLPGFETLWRLSRMGGAGVSLFFILSGFILFYIYERALVTRQFKTRDFFVSRFARIYPVYLVGLALALPGFVAAITNAAQSGAQYAELKVAMTVPLLVQAWHPVTACRWNCPGWSLSAEMFFYALFPLIGLFAARLRQRKIPLALLAVYGLIIAAPLSYLIAGLPTDNDDINAIPDLMVLRFNPLLRLPEFILGVLVARATLSVRGQAPRWCVRVAAAAVVVALYGSYYLPPSVSETLVQNGVFAPLFALLIVAIAKSPPAARVAGPWVHLGAASYALYIIHIPIWGMFRFAARIGIVDDPTQNLALYFGYLGVVLGGSILVHRCVEVPCRNMIRRWFRERQRRDGGEELPIRVGVAVAPVAHFEPEAPTPISVLR